MKLFNQLLQGIFLPLFGAGSLLYATGTEIGTGIVTDEKINPSMVNSLDATDIVNLSAHFTNSTVVVNNFIIKSLPSDNFGVLYMADGVTAVVAGQQLSELQSDGLTFDPIESCTASDATFTYVGVSNAGVEGTVATVTIPLTIPTTGCVTVITDEKRNSEIVNLSGAVEIVNLSGEDSNGDAVNSFIITSVPNINQQGTLYMADGTTAIRVGQLLTLNEANGLKFDPNSSFVGDVRFTYIAVDNGGTRGNSATVTIPIIAPPVVIVPIEVQRPIADNRVNLEMLNSLGAVNILDLSGRDGSGNTITHFIIVSLPTLNQGILYMDNGTIKVELNQTLTEEEANGLKFDPNDNFVGEVTFTYLALDDNGLKSDPATVTIPLVSPVKVEDPTADDKVNSEMLNSLDAVNILDLSGKDSNGEPVSNFIITLLPQANQGILYLSNGETAVSVNQPLTLEEANGLRFNPNANFVGNVTFTYIAVDANGLKSLDATVTIPLVNPIVVNPVVINTPTADNSINPEMLNSLGAVNILDLSGKDGNGNVLESFIITSLPNITEGILYLADGTTAVRLNQSLTIEETNGLKFNPNSNFVGVVTFTYVVVDETGIKSADATVTIPLIAPNRTDIIANSDEGMAHGNADPITINVLANDSGTFDGATVQLVDSNGNRVQELTVTGEGIWRVDDNNNVIFTPITPFIGTPTSVTYTVQDQNGELSNNTAINISGQCVCKAYREDIPVFSSLGLFLMFIFSTIIGSLLIKREIG